MRQRGLRRAIAVIALCLAGAAGVTVFGGDGATGAAASADVDAFAGRPARGASAASAPAASDPWALANRATAEVERAAADEARERDYLLDPRNDAEWCRRGAPASRRAYEAREARRDQQRPHAGASVEAMIEARRRVLRHWGQVLTNRGDEASLATRDHLLASNPVRMFTFRPAEPLAEVEHAAGRLLELGRRSSDPYVIGLAFHSGCARGGECRDELLARWARAEPDGLRVNFHLLGRQIERKADASEPLQRIATGTGGIAHRKLLLQHLLSLPRTSAVGLLREAEIGVLATAISTAPDANAWPILGYCSEAGADGKAACKRIAERLYSEEPTLMARLHALVLAGGRLDLPPPPGWEARDDEVVAAWHAGQEAVRGDFSRDMEIGYCETGAERLAMYTDLATLDEQTIVIKRLRAQGIDIAAYAALARKK